MGGPRLPPCRRVQPGCNFLCPTGCYSYEREGNPRRAGGEDPWTRGEEITRQAGATHRHTPLTLSSVLGSTSLTERNRSARGVLFVLPTMCMCMQHAHVCSVLSSPSPPLRCVCVCECLVAYQEYSLTHSERGLVPCTDRGSPSLLN